VTEAAADIEEYLSKILTMVLVIMMCKMLGQLPHTIQEVATGPLNHLSLSASDCVGLSSKSWWRRLVTKTRFVFEDAV